MFTDNINTVRFLGGWKTGSVGNNPMDLVYRDKDGTLKYRWDHIRNRLDKYVALGYTDVTVVLDNIPYDLPAIVETGEYGNVNPPKNWNEWYDFIHELCVQLVSR